MQKFLWLIAMLTISLQLSAQQRPGGFAGGKPPSIGRLYGKILDNEGKPMPYTSVIVFQNRFDSATRTKKDVLIKGVITQNNGEFNLEELPIIGPLVLKVSATGFKPYSQVVSFITKKPAPGTMPSFDKDLGNIKLTSDISQLQGVTVTASKPLMKVDMDKKVFNVEKNISSAGGTALDVMKNVPSVNVDIDGNMTMRNAAPQLYIDGRPTTLTLDQIPADAIESVEVMTAPSAKYDASGGGAGIVNIVLKKNRKTGYNGNLRAGVDKRGGINGGADFNLRQGKLNLTASGMINQMRDRTTGKTDRYDISHDPDIHTLQENTSKSNGGFMFGRLGADYFATNRTTLSISGIRVHGSFKPSSILDINTDTLFSGAPTTAFSRRVTSGHRVFNGTGLVLGMKHLFPHEGEELTVDANYFGGNAKNNSDYNTDFYNIKGGAVTSNQLEKISGNGKMRNITAQTDYVKPIGAKGKLEAGLRANFRHIENANYNYLFNEATDQYDLTSGNTSNYKNNESVYAAYLTFSNSIHNFSYKLGLRGESSKYTGELIQTGQQFSNSYPTSLFPTIFLSQKLKHDQEVQLSATRRINRPNFFQLIPFADSTDKLNITKGNPGLVPEFTQSLELSYLKTFKGNHTFLGSVYYKYTDNTITSYIDRQTDPTTGNTALINTFINAKGSYTTGAEFTVQNYFTKWWDMSTNINMYNSKVDAGQTDVANQKALWSVFGKLNSNFKLPAAFDLQLTATYQSKTNLPINTNNGFGGGPPGMEAQSSSQGYIRSFYGIDLALKKSFLKTKALSATIGVSDIFRTRKTDQYSYSAYFTQNYTRLRNPQMIRLNIAYRFGKIDASLFKRKSQGSGNQGMMDGIQ
ncbi:TonB-dependent receptor [Chitinophaga ginsengisoli]|uniref:Outer membrane receptor protein involved in Fe transport n=1 Tax=Chitinophaga ginsengisoli TaxID=363837 RepID=A0A2P8FDX7_9BACT|nr:TonB-dependent receptor [Chitinophaga ginsengisoli]PSL19917.1 outer membrane receptor protein involved in Fe transport [Chitinophaga ginsengisoli]